MMRQRAWITGGDGLIASYLLRDAGSNAPECEAIRLNRERVDLLDFDAVEREFRRDAPTVVIHCAALSRTGACDADPQLARRVNVGVTRHLAELCASIPFVFFSTDLVFDGRSGNYPETAPVNPRSRYAETKAEAEQVVLRNPRHTVIRTSLNVGVSRSGGRAFNEEIKRAWLAGLTLSLFHDEFRSPIAAAVTARAVWELVLGNRVGLYHLAGAARLSRLEIGRSLARRWPEIRPLIEQASIKDFPGPPRSPDTSLDCSRIQEVLSFRLPGFDEWLEANPEEPV